ncbi:MAG: hypothetical protein HWD58_04410 [Bacteroidota bacterium]|nr:MAG: hypothetical protein HWD58_04410 [Bacteroidota bacterium]
MLCADSVGGLGAKPSFFTIEGCPVNFNKVFSFKFMHRYSTFTLWILGKLKLICSQMKTWSGCKPMRANPCLRYKVLCYHKTITSPDFIGAGYSSV